ncbi:uncharacterized protein LOC120121177 [Hibiscus syriacus]|uniref:uncharacterized protein LOC120121177 n=1 Tax=Hibiscus syriacus TaxID=106335 RepID=UPI001920F219|nr:uncharacterized protein LOC120121177 [Hibiscus syriacus]
MSSGRSSSTVVGKKSKKTASNSKSNAVSLRDKLKMVENEEDALLKHIDDLNNWTDAIDGMNDEQLKAYLENRPQELKSVNNQKKKPEQKRKPKVQKIMKSKPSTCSGIMASVWKFHKEDDDKVNKGINHTIPAAD